MDTKFHINPGSGTVSRCRAATQKCPFGGESGHENHFNTPGEARSGFEKLMKSEVLPKTGTVARSRNTTKREAPKTKSNERPLSTMTEPEARDLVLKASADHGRQIRTYLRLLNYGNYEMAKNLRQSLNKDVVEMVVSYSRLSALVTDTKLLIAKTERWKRDARIPVKAESYGRQIVRQKEKLNELEVNLSKSSQKLTAAKALYTAKLSEHNASVARLHSYQLEVKNGATTNVCLSMPLDRLPKTSKGALEGEFKERSLKMLDDLNSRDHDRILAAARISGNEYHVDSAIGYKAHNRKIKQLDQEIKSIEVEYERSSDGHAIETRVRELSKKLEGKRLTLDNEIRVRNDYARRLELFRSEVKDELAYNSRLSEEVREIVEFGD